MNITNTLLLSAALAALPLSLHAQGAPLAAGQKKFLGSIHSPGQIETRRGAVPGRRAQSAPSATNRASPAGVAAKAVTD